MTGIRNSEARKRHEAFETLLDSPELARVLDLPDTGRTFVLQDASGTEVATGDLTYIATALGYHDSAPTEWSEDLARPESDGYVAATFPDGALAWITTVEARRAGDRS